MPLLKDSESISLFRQLPYASSASRARQTRGAPMKIGEIGEMFISKLKARAGGEREVIAKNWGTIVPGNFLNKSSPERVRAGVLYVRTQNAAVKQEMCFAERKMLERIRSFELCAGIKKIRFV